MEMDDMNKSNWNVLIFDGDIPNKKMIKFTIFFVENHHAFLFNLI